MSRAIPLIITPRSEWGALPPTEPPKPLFHPVESVVVYPDTQTKICKSKKSCIKLLQKLQKRHMERRGLPDIKFNFLIGLDGRVYEGTGWFHKGHGTHVSIYPELDQCFSICFIGNFGDCRQPMYMINKTKRFLKYAVDQKYIVENYRRYMVKARTQEMQLIKKTIF